MDVDKNSTSLERQVERLSKRAAGSEVNVDSNVERASGFSRWALLVLALGGLATLFWALILAQFVVQFFQALIGWMFA